MASMKNHETVEIWHGRHHDDVYHVTKNDRIVRTTGPRGGGAKILHVLERDGRVIFNFSGQGRRATATEFRSRLEELAVRQ